MKGVHFLAAAALALCGCGPAWLKKPAGQFGVAARAGVRSVKRLSATAAETCRLRALLDAAEKRITQPGARPGFDPLSLPAPLPAGARLTWGGLCAQQDAAGRVFLASLATLEAYAAALATASGAAGLDAAAWTSFTGDAAGLAALLGSPAGESPAAGPFAALLQDATDLARTAELRRAITAAQRPVEQLLASAAAFLDAERAQEADARDGLRTLLSIADKATPAREAGQPVPAGLPAEALALYGFWGGSDATLAAGEARVAQAQALLAKLGAAHAELVKAAAADNPDDTLSALVQLHSRELVQLLGQAIP